MSFIIQEIPTPTIFGIATQTSEGAGGEITFEVGSQDELFYEGYASADFDVNVIYDPTTSLDVAMQDGDIANLSLKITTGVSAVSLNNIKIDGLVAGNVYSFGEPWDAPPLLISGGVIADISLEIVKIATNNFQVFAKRENFSYIGGTPSAPGTPSASMIDGTSVLVNFAAASGGAYGVDLYTVISSPSGITAASASAPITVPGLTENVTYTFDVYATNEIGSGPTAGPSNPVTPVTPAGQQAYSVAGTYSWVAPAGVTSVSVVAIGGGSSGAGPSSGGYGGGLGYKNNIAVVPGTSYTVVVGVGGAQVSGFGSNNGGDSSFISTATVKGGGGTISTGTGGTFTGDGGGNGGNGGGSAGGGGAGGYAGNGGNGGANGASGTSGSGGGGGGGAGNPPPSGSSVVSTGGGGTDYFGQGANGAGATYAGSGGQGSPGGTPSGAGNNGGLFGGAGGFRDSPRTGFGGGNGGVRIIWSGASGIPRAFPSTNTGDL